MTDSKDKSHSQAVRALKSARSLILSGVFCPGEKLPEPVLASRLGVSRTPLREALATLEKEGLVERLQSGRCQVSSYTIQDIVDAIEFRGTTEGLAARLAAERGISNEILAECRQVLAALDKLIDTNADIKFERYVELNAAFHSWISRAASSVTLERELERIGKLPLASPSAFLKGRRPAGVQKSSIPNVNIARFSKPPWPARGLAQKPCVRTCAPGARKPVPCDGRQSAEKSPPFALTNN